MTTIETPALINETETAARGYLEGLVDCNPGDYEDATLVHLAALYMAFEMTDPGAISRAESMILALGGLYGFTVVTSELCADCAGLRRCAHGMDTIHLP